MKILFYLLSFILTAPVMHAQESWKITLNNKTVLSTSNPDETLNTKKIKSTEWKKNGFLEISYIETPPSNWLHSIQFDDETGNQLLSKDSVYAKIPVATIRKLMAGKKQLKIYMVVSPSNPESMVPSRRHHLCTLKLP
jgi:ligand-binding SRPBCC domain-containing protein